MADEFREVWEKKHLAHMNANANSISDAPTRAFRYAHGVLTTSLGIKMEPAHLARTIHASPQLLIHSRRLSRNNRFIREN